MGISRSKGINICSTMSISTSVSIGIITCTSISIRVLLYVCVYIYAHIHICTHTCYAQHLTAPPCLPSEQVEGPSDRQKQLLEYQPLLDLSQLKGRDSFDLLGPP